MKKKINILLAEDDPNLGTLLSEFLKAKNFDVVLSKDGEEAIKNYRRSAFDFIILDVMMPKKDGFAVAEEIRQIDRHVPILFLTAKSMKEDTLKGFKLGADDYMTKPFSMDELQARILAILRRSSEFPLDGEEAKEFEIGSKYAFDYNKQRLTMGDEDIRLTTKENELLFLLCKHKNDILERSHALKTIWGDDNYFNGRSMDVYIAKLRKHLKEDEKVEIINVHGKGFKLIDA